MRAAIRCPYGITVGMDEALARLQPSRSPLDSPGDSPARVWAKLCLSRPNSGYDGGLIGDSFGKAFKETARKFQERLRWSVARGQERRIALPTDLDATKQVRF